MDFITIWNNAYDIFCDGGEESLEDYLNSQVAVGTISKADASCMKEDVIETHSL